MTRFQPVTAEAMLELAHMLEASARGHWRLDAERSLKIVAILRDLAAPAVAAREPTDQELAGWARNWHWNDCADDRPVDPSIYFRDMRMLKAFVDKFASTVSRPHRGGGQ